MKNKEKEYLYFLLSDALMHIRAIAYESGNMDIHWISNFYHNLPGKLLHHDEPYENILKDLKANAVHYKMEVWFQDRLMDIDQIFELQKRNSDNH